MNRLLILLGVLLCLEAGANAHAQTIAAEGGAQSLLIDPSVRASGMGRASNAVFWGPGSNYWSNPALLAYHQGLEYEWGRTQLVPDLAEHVFFTTKRVTAGYWGLGILIAGRPSSKVGGQRLDYGVSIATDVDGNEIGRFTSYEEVQSLGGGANILEFSEHVMRAGGLDPPPLTRYGDVAVGWSEKKAHVFLAPADLTLGQSRAEGFVTTHDSGLLIRATPYNAIDYPGLLPALDRIARTRVDVSHGRSTQNYDDAKISYIDQDQADPIVRFHLTGWTAHVAVALPSSAQKALESEGLGWLPAWITPFVSWGKVWDKETPMILDRAAGTGQTGTRVQKKGWELTLANIYTIRRGWIDDPAGTIQGKTTGWGLGLHVKNLAGFSYDEATVPQSIYLGRVHRKSFTLYANPIEAWGAVHHRRGGVAAAARK